MQYDIYRPMKTEGKTGKYMSYRPEASPYYYY